MLRSCWGIAGHEHGGRYIVNKRCSGISNIVFISIAVLGKTAVIVINGTTFISSFLYQHLPPHQCHPFHRAYHCYHHLRLCGTIYRPGFHCLAMDYFSARNLHLPQLGVLCHSFLGRVAGSEATVCSPIVNGVLPPSPMVAPSRNHEPGVIIPIHPYPKLCC